MLYLGIDPGLKGYFALLDSQAQPVAHWPMPLAKGKIDPHVLLEFLEEQILAQSVMRLQSIVVGVESVLVMPTDTVKGKAHDGRKGILTMGINYGYLIAGIVAHGWRHTCFSPRTWQKRMHVGADRSLPAKARSLQVARRLWPDESWKVGKSTKIHDGMVDSFLIAEHTRREWEGG